MPPVQDRSVALWFVARSAAVLVLLFAWLSVLSFDVADSPADSVWPPPENALNLCGSVGARLAFRLHYALGLGSYALLALASLGVAAMRPEFRPGDLWLRFLGLTMVVTAASTAAAILFEPSEGFLMTGPGGVLGTAVADALVPRLKSGGGALALILLTLTGLVLAADQTMIRVARWLGWVGRRSAPILRDGGATLSNAGMNALQGATSAVAAGISSLTGRLATAGAAGPTPDTAKGRPGETRLRRMAAAISEQIDAVDADDESDAEPIDDDLEEVEDADLADADDPQTELNHSSPAPRSRSIEKSTSAGRTPAVSQLGPPSRSAPRTDPRPKAAVDGQPYQLPPLSLLEEPTPIDRHAIEMLCQEKRCILEQTLNEFRLEVQVVSIHTGPVITVFELKLAPGIKVSQIASLTNDMARALKAPSVRVVAPLPGKNTIGIEVPNIDKERVRLKDIICAYGTKAEGNAVPLYLGKDASGQSLVGDLTRMPHMLIAGTTGSGKSVCISSIILSILMTRTPDDVKLILVDPKVVELAMFKDIPHLMCPIVTEMSKAEAILDWAATKMDERYALLAEAGVKDIRSYNRLGYEGLKERLMVSDDAEMERIPLKLPYIVIVIDELADLMMTSAKEVEFYLCRLAQKSRAVGIHLIVSTQRPQANVVTGLIKSNLPSRIAFRVSSRLDSRIVLDQNGGEVLMGQGDMLFLPPGQSKLLRAQGTFISDEELRAVVKYCRSQGEPDFHPELVRTPGAGGGTTERDELFDDAVDVILETGRGSVSLLQRRLTIGYGRASRLIDQMYEAGIVGEYKGSQAREVVVTKDEWQAIKAQRNREETEDAGE